MSTAEILTEVSRSPSHDYQADDGYKEVGSPLVESGQLACVASSSDGDFVLNSYTDNQMLWQRVGNVVHYWFLMSAAPTFTTGAGNFRILLPIDPILVGWSYYPNAGDIALYTGSTLDTGLDQLYFEPNSADSWGYVKDKDANGIGGSAKTVAQLFTSGSDVWMQGQGFYFIEPGATFAKNGNY